MHDILTPICSSWRSSMAEQRFCKPQVGGSIPLASSIISADNSTSSRIAEPLLSPVNKFIYEYPGMMAERKKTHHA